LQAQHSEVKISALQRQKWPLFNNLNLRQTLRRSKHDGSKYLKEITLILRQSGGNLIHLIDLKIRAGID
jgi:hypothetical protein